MLETNRTYIICHMMSTIDGKITGGNGVDIMSDQYFGLYTQTENSLPAHTGWMCGRVTMEMFAAGKETPLPPLNKEIDSSNFIAPHSGNLYMFGVDPKGVLRWKSNTIKLSNVSEPLNLVVIVSSSTPKEYLQYLQEMEISYIVSGEVELDLNSLFTTIKEKFDVKTLLLEGGAILNGSVMSKGLVDEISLLVTPLVANQYSAPSTFEENELLNIKEYSLIEVKNQDKSCVWLRYKK